ncbi:MAG: hypothetical protein ABSE25_13970 [Syntrophorhabdales bacterium]
MRRILENQIRMKGDMEADRAVVVVRGAVRVMMESETQDGEG